MNKKLFVISILSVFMLIAISLVTAVSSNTNTTVKKKESPLFGIRTKLAIGDKLKDLREKIKARFIGERVFFLPLQFLKKVEPFSMRDYSYTRLKGDYTNAIGCCPTVRKTCLGS